MKREDLNADQLLAIQALERNPIYPFYTEDRLVEIEERYNLNAAQIFAICIVMRKEFYGIVNANTPEQQRCVDDALMEIGENLEQLIKETKAKN